LALTERGLEIRQIEASKIEEDSTAIVVFFKMNLSTGWDCPRAETMMSFRRARDFTHVAQLLGRMIRTPLARRIDSDAELNNVNLYLPYFNEDTVKTVIDSLRDSEAIVPGEVGTDKELVTLKRNRTFADVFDAMSKQVTYTVDSTRKTTALKLYIQLSRALTMDAIDLNAQKAVKNAVLTMIGDEIAKLKENGRFDEIAENITGLSLEAMTVDYLDDTDEDAESAQTLDVLEKDIDTRFAQAGRQFGEGLHNDYWAKNGDRDHLEVKTEIIVLASCLDALERLNEFAELRRRVNSSRSVVYGFDMLPRTVKSLICSHIRKPSVDMFPQRKLQLKIFWLLIFDSYPLLSKHVECCVLMSRVS
jgi:type III restriction enzyme